MALFAVCLDSKSFRTDVFAKLGSLCSCYKRAREQQPFVHTAVSVKMGSFETLAAARVNCWTGNFAIRCIPDKRLGC